MCFFYRIQNGICKMTAHHGKVVTVYLIAFLIFFVTVYNLSIVISTIIMALNLKNKRHTTTVVANDKGQAVAADSTGNFPKNASGKDSFDTEDQKAVRTVVSTCLWNIFCIYVIASFYFVFEKPAFDLDLISTEALLVVHGISRCFNALSNSLNFLFYMRAKTFDSTFHQKWSARWLKWKP